LSLTSLDNALPLRAGRKLIFTNGVFDILHAGHVQYLAAARKMGDLLIVGINTDASVKRLNKGADRPIHSLEDRAAVLAALRSVDAVVSFDDDTPVRLIEVLKPEIHVKGGDYTAEQLPETAIVRGYGGQVVILPLLQGRSSTAALKKMGVE
jgi:rfaE bifunctional protein nucleotidyltransferase chain/domain